MTDVNVTPPARSVPDAHAGADPLQPAHADGAAALDELCRAIWPEPARVSPARAGGGSVMVIPSARRPRMIVPSGRRAAAEAVGRPGQGRWLVMRSGLGGLVFRDRLRVDVPPGAETFESYVRDRLGIDVAVSAQLRTARVNRKPVLRLLAPDGTTVGFAKIGVTPLTHELVRREGEALERLNGERLEHLTVPDVLHAGDWDGRSVLVMKPLAMPQRQAQPSREACRDAMVEISGVGEVARGPLAAAPYWRDLTGRLAAVADTADRSALVALLADLAARHGETALTYGAWHGDWTPWNMAATPAGLVVWDWERFAVDAPIGFDALHHRLWTAIVSARQNRRSAAEECIANASSTLEPFGVGPAAAALTAVVYLAELATRVLIDRQASGGTHPPEPGRWLIPAIAGWTAGR